VTVSGNIQCRCASRIVALKPTAKSTRSEPGSPPNFRLNAAFPARSFRYFASSGFF
jgi:hypothetical protein